MKGATAEPDVKTTRPPSRTKQKIIGKSQNFFRSFMNDHSSKRNSPIDSYLHVILNRQLIFSLRTFAKPQ